IPASFRIRPAVVRPIPYIYESEITAGLSAGISTPRIRGICWSLLLSLPLLVPRVRADDAHHPPPPHDAAILADSSDAASHLHRCTTPQWLWVTKPDANRT